MFLSMIFPEHTSSIFRLKRVFNTHTLEKVTRELNDQIDMSSTQEKIYTDHETYVLFLRYTRRREGRSLTPN